MSKSNRGDKLPFKNGQSWSRANVPVGKGASQHDDLDVELTDEEIEACMGWDRIDTPTEGLNDERLFVALDQYVMILDEEMGYDVPRETLKAKVIKFVDDYFELTDEPVSG